jgi:hypothetical protein
MAATQSVITLGNHSFHAYGGFLVAEATQHYLLNLTNFEEIH